MNLLPIYYRTTKIYYQAGALDPLRAGRASLMTHPIIIRFFRPNHPIRFRPIVRNRPMKSPNRQINDRHPGHYPDIYPDILSGSNPAKHPAILAGFLQTL